MGTGSGGWARLEMHGSAGHGRVLVQTALCEPLFKRFLDPVGCRLSPDWSKIAELEIAPKHASNAS